jgi:hypothetical protein
MKITKIFMLSLASMLSVEVVAQTCQLKIMLVPDTVACRFEFPPPRGSSSPKQFTIHAKVITGTPVTFNWSNGATGPMLKPDSSGVYQVIATDVSGCSVSARVVVREYGVNNFASSPNFLFERNCLGDTTRFMATPTSAIDKITWGFGNGQSADGGLNGRLAYPVPGTYVVSMRLTNRCGLDTTVVKNVSIYAPPAKPTLPTAVSLCSGPINLDANSSSTPIASYHWSTGATNKIISVNEAAVVSVTNTDQNGCKSSATTFVTELRPNVNLGSNRSLCQFSTVLPLSASNPGMSYSWQFNGSSNGNSSQTQQIETTQPGDFDYSVLVRDPITNCFRSSSVNIKILQAPQKPTLPNSISICTSPVLLDANSNVEPGLSYLWSTGATSRSIEVASSSVISVTNRNQAGCTSTAQVNVGDARPAKPSIFVINPIKIASSSTVGNQWFKDGVALSGEKNQELVLRASGTYNVQTTQTGCVSEKSDDYQFTITSTGQNEQAFELFPNPSNGRIIFKAQNLKSWVVYDNFGKEVKLTAGEGTVIDLSECAPGIYFLKWSDGEGIRINQIIKH